MFRRQFGRSYDLAQVCSLNGSADRSVLAQRENFANTQPVCSFTEPLCVAPISISQQVARRAVPREGLAKGCCKTESLTP
jgi:hypothetical protein